MIVGLNHTEAKVVQYVSMSGKWKDDPRSTFNVERSLDKCKLFCALPIITESKIDTDLITTLNYAFKPIENLFDCIVSKILMHPETFYNRKSESGFVDCFEPFEAHGCVGGIWTAQIYLDDTIPVDVVRCETDW